MASPQKRQLKNEIGGYMHSMSAGKQQSQNGKTPFHMSTAVQHQLLVQNQQRLSQLNQLGVMYNPRNCNPQGGSLYH